MSVSEYEGFVLRPGPVWDSVEDLLQGGEGSLKGVASGVVASLRSPVGRFRLLSEDDFQALYGVARDVRRVAAELDAVRQAARDGVDADTVQGLVATLVELADGLGALPVRTGHESLEPEGLDLDEAELDLALDAADLYSE